MNHGVRTHSGSVLPSADVRSLLSLPFPVTISLTKLKGPAGQKHILLVLCSQPFPQGRHHKPHHIVCAAEPRNLWLKTQLGETSSFGVKCDAYSSIHPPRDGACSFKIFLCIPKLEESIKIYVNDIEGEEI